MDRRPPHPGNAPLFSAPREVWPAICISGSQFQSGAYLLRLQVHADLGLAFGRFRDGQRIEVPAGEYVYVGSARGERGSASLARRLLRHATRCADRPAHPIRTDMLSAFQAAGLGGPGLALPTGKRLFWQVDYLLDQLAVELDQVIVIRSRRALEPALARLLDGQGYTRPLARGLGASDASGSTHLMRVDGAWGWWGELAREVGARFAPGLETGRGDP